MPSGRRPVDSSDTPGVTVLANQPPDCLLRATAHELRLPLSHIKGFVSTLRRRDIEWDDETRRDFLAQIENETDRLAELVDGLLDDSSVGRERARHLRRQATAPVALVHGGLDRVRGLLKGRYVEVNVPADLPLVEVDVPAIERVIANLVNNALKYAPGDSHIRLTARANRDCLELRVEDDGPGISSVDSQHIFEQFYRGPQAESSGQPGSGLGLAICLSIVSAHGGRIWADAPPEGGARFTVVLPLSADHAAPGRDSNRGTQSGACSYAARPTRRATHHPYHRPPFGPQD
jgi:two-component system, OmpR family, sensor histidine kinase KdpD